MPGLIEQERCLSYDKMSSFSNINENFMTSSSGSNDSVLRPTAQLALLSATLIWGWTFPVMKESLAQIGPLTFLFYRFALAFVILLLLFGPQLRRVELQIWRNGALMGLALFLGYWFQAWGLKFTAANNSAFITGLSVVLVPLFGTLIYRDRIGRAAWIGVSCSALGLGLIVFGRGFELLAVNVGDFLTMLCAISFAFHILWVSHFTRPENHIPIMIAQIGVTALLSGLGMILAEGASWPASNSLWEAILVTSLLATALTLWIQMRFQPHSTAVRTAIIFSTEPIFAGIFSYLLLGEQFINWQWLGAVLIIAAMIISQWPMRGKQAL